MSNSLKLFDILSKNTAHAISMLVDESTFMRGRAYHLEHRVKSFEWDKKQDGRLVVQVQGKKLYTVKIIYGDTGIRYLCTCPAWITEQICKHVICVLLTAREELSFPEECVSLDKELSETLVLSSNMKNVNITTLHIFPAKNLCQLINPGFTVLFMRGQEKLSVQHFAPSSLEASLCIASKQDRYIEEQLFELLSGRLSLLYQLTIHTAAGPIDVTWDKNYTAKPVTELNLIDEGVLVKPVLLAANGVILSNIIRIGKRFVIDLDAKKLIAIDMIAWPWCEQLFYDKVQDLERNIKKMTVEERRIIDNDNANFAQISKPLLLSTKQFNEQYPIHYPIGQYSFYQASFITKNQGLLVTIPLLHPTFVVDGLIDFIGKTITFSLFGAVGEYKLKQICPIMEYVQAIATKLPSWLHTKKRRNIIIQGLFALIGIKNELESHEIIRKILVELRDTVFSSKRYVEVKQFFIDFSAEIVRSASEMVVVENDSFNRVELNPIQLATVVSLLTTMFGDELVFNEDNQHVSFTVSLALFYAQVTKLKPLLDVYKIELRVNNKRLQTQVLDIAVNAKRRKGEDWLDLEPHILADGVVLSSEQREILFSKDGHLLETADCIRILDPVSQDIIKMLARIFVQKQNGAQINEKQRIIEIPRLRVLDLLELRQKGATIRLPEEDENLLERLTNFSKIEKLPVPKKFTGTLRDYQKDGYCWLGFLYKNRFGACLADDMGLGKTIQTIAFLGGIAENIIVSRNLTGAPHLIIVPPTLIFNWQHELNVFYPDLTVTIYTSKEQCEFLHNYSVVLATYDRIRLDIDFLKDIQFHVLILDEAQAIKNIEAARTAAIRQLKSIFTISLTGTPLENHLGEYHSIIDVALPGLLPQYKVFMRSVQDETHDSFIKKTRPFVLRRTKDAVLLDLPEKVESNIVLDMAEKQQKVYATTVAEIKRVIDNAYETKSSGQASIIALTAILRLRQICISPQMIDKTKDVPSPKIDYLISNLESVVQEGNAALVFSQFTTCLDLIEIALNKAGIAYYRIDGKTTMASRRKIVESFQANDAGISILLLSLKTGGVGLNLTRANYVYHIDPWWNPAVENQASDRSHRIGQKNTVFVSRLVMHHTIEEKMMTLKEAKQRLFSEVMEQAENKTKSIISKKDFDFLLS